jgi:hypothetical protein
MFTQEDVNIIAKDLPTEAVMEIHKTTKISRPTIYKFLAGKKVRSNFGERIYVCALEIIKRNKLNEKRIRTQRNKILSIK